MAASSANMDPSSYATAAGQNVQYSASHAGSNVDMAASTANMDPSSYATAAGQNVQYPASHTSSAGATANTAASSTDGCHTDNGAKSNCLASMHP
jgi:hypothetical protein